MLIDIVEARATGDHRLYLRFKNGVEGEVDLGERLRFEGVFAVLRDPKEFAKVTVHEELKTVVWPNGADLDPDVLYAQLTGEPIELGRPEPAGAQ